jgi:alanine racemase
METRVVIDEAALYNNASIIAKAVAPLKFMAVIKGNASGHGLARIAAVLAQHSGVDCLCTSKLSELVHLLDKHPHLRKRKRMFAWLYSVSDAGLLGKAQRYGIELSVSNSEQYEALTSRYPRLRLHIALNTALQREGFTDYGEALERARGPAVAGLWTHLPFAYSPPENTDELLRGFNQVAQAVVEHHRAQGRELLVHVGTSASIGMGLGAHANACRIGRLLYGWYPLDRSRAAVPGLAPCYTLESYTLNSLPVAKGSLIGYRSSSTGQPPAPACLAPSDGYVSTVPLGFADGISPTWKDGLTVFIPRLNKTANVIALYMDMLQIWTEARIEGERVELFSHGLDTLCHATGLSEQQLLSSIRVPDSSEPHRY